MGIENIGKETDRLYKQALLDIKSALLNIDLASKQVSMDNYVSTDAIDLMCKIMKLMVKLDASCHYSWYHGSELDAEYKRLYRKEKGYEAI